MKGYELSINDFRYLISVISKHHAKRLGSWIRFTVHSRKGSIYFRDGAGDEISLSEMHNIFQADDKLQRQVYNLYMSYAR